MTIDQHQLDTWLKDNLQRVIDVRHDIHAHPELGFDTPLTCHALTTELQADGLEPVAFRGGLYVDIGPQPPRVGLRADIDALPLPEQTGLPFSSVFEGRMHACGHDVHAAVAMGAALALADQPELPVGVRVVFQPAEEVLGGAESVIEAGLLDGIEQMYALHCEPHHDVGTAGTRSGPITAACDNIKVRLRSTGGHTARPHLTVDMVDALARLATGLPALASRRVDPRAALSIVFGSIRAGDAANAIPAEGVLQGSIRVLSLDVWRNCELLVRGWVDELVGTSGADVEVDYMVGVPPVDNHPEAAYILRQAISSVCGANGVFVPHQSMGGEDFAWYGDRTRIALARLGVRAPGAPITDLHQSAFMADDGAIEVGVRIMVAAATAAAHDIAGDDL
ncbi:amidohydrolase [Blastococcus sp. Marseille-P5729]|uniref:amidohydrolase n=1 Tax=Blastococcus sp. Marseille-P5729 TaxID=2086582 RepID=UPI000D0F3C2E|nr:amidohydrolase [Blastococcus sp. Marseille-P5729]